jgi:hypothetical protein
MMMRCLRISLIVSLAVFGGTLLVAQGAYRLSRDHPAIQYSTRETNTAVDRLNERLERGEVRLDFEAPPRGYLQSALRALDIPVASQILVFSENSLQRAHISMGTPRAIYFNDTVALSWSKGADTVEATVLDPVQGIHFYTLDQTQQSKPRFSKRTDCLQCHLTDAETSGIPGLFAMSVLPLSDNPNEYAQGWAMDHRTPIEDRWGGWFVTGAQVPRKHLGNVAVLHVPKSYVRADVAPRLESGSAAFDASAYLTPHSDIAALLVFNHQLHMTNLLIRLGWLARVALAPAAPRAPDLTDAVREVVDYLLFVDEAPLPSPVRGATSFAQDFAAKGPRDSKGRSLRDLDLSTRLLRYPCSYMIYSDAFDALPARAKEMVYQELWNVLSSAHPKLSADDRRAIVEILRDTKTGLPEYFQSAAR